MARNNLDSIDRRILCALQKNSTISNDALADSVGLSSTGCWRRVRKLEQDGVIAGRVTLLDPASLGLALIGYVMVRTRDHGDKWFTRFTETVLALPGVIELHRTTGDTDYMLKIVARDLAAYNKIYRAISKLPDIAEVRSAFSMEAIKVTTEMPLDL